MIDPGTRAQTIAVVAEILEIDAQKVRGDQRLREDLGMDSLASLELLSTLGERLDVDFELDDAMGISTVDDACAFVDRLRRAQNGRLHA